MKKCNEIVCDTCSCAPPCLCRFAEAAREILEPRPRFENAILAATVLGTAGFWVFVSVGAVVGWGWLIGFWR